MLAVLHLIPDADTAGIVVRLAAVLTPGSLMVISRLTSDFAPGGVTAPADACNNAVKPG